MPWPSAGFFTGFATQGQLRQALDDMLERSRAQVGADGVANATIASDAVTGASLGSLRLYGQGAAPDDLLSLSTSNYSEGQIVELRIGDVNQAVTIKHSNSPGAGQFVTADGLDHVLNALEQRIAFERTGAYWTETERRGRELLHIVGAPDEPVYSSSWNGSFVGGYDAAFYKDEAGLVHLRGYLEHPALSSATSLLFTLPPRYRPPVWLRSIALTAVGGVEEVGRIDIETDGDVRWLRVTGGAPAAAAVRVVLQFPPFRAAA